MSSPSAEGSTPQERARASTRLKRFLIGDGGQELVEYAVLAMLLGLAGYAALLGTAGAVNTTYTTWDTRVQSLWEPSPAQP